VSRAASVDEAYAGFYDASYGPVVAQVYALVGDLSEAQDVAQEAFLRLWTRWERVSTYDDPAAWVRRVATNLAISRWRKARYASRAIIRHGPPSDVAEPSVDSVSLVSALQEIPAPQRRALVLHHMAGFSVAAVAEIERTAVGTVKTRLFHGRAALARLLADTAVGNNFGVNHG
jgi:RNA polymerase sigma-70 factor, ECF subfamily